ncbi:hypothetical protein EX30DRAFT_371624 [Ascodesmis nigricans]|uniref:A-kinase anchor protein 7-like phosphoesterase domain-containing protein n=1 Tax=Ascodesmis nigricans TaxID=341454 RepID=A0A4S2MX78_9PEZI|nr:hypothetical protein EX30DRAFT_371624 [Ascodesmis nigricans]
MASDSAYEAFLLNPVATGNTPSPMNPESTPTTTPRLRGGRGGDRGGKGSWTRRWRGDYHQNRNTTTTSNPEQSRQEAAPELDEAGKPKQRQGHRQKHPKSPKEKQPRLTHFICIPVHTAPDIAGNLEVLRPRLEELGLHRDCIRPAVCLHLTIGVMSLLEEVEVEKARRMVEGLRLRELMVEAERAVEVKDEGGASSSTTGTSPALPGAAALVSEAQTTIPPTTAVAEPPASPPPPPPINLTLTGLSAFPKPRDARVLYAIPHDPTGRLQRFAEKVRDRFVEEGLMKVEKGREKLVLHATVANTTYAPKGKKAEGDGEEVEEEEVKVKVKVAEVRENEDQAQAQVQPQTQPLDLSLPDLTQEEELSLRAAPENQLPELADPPPPGEKKPSKKHHRRYHYRPPRFDATQLVEDMREFTFAEQVSVDGIALCRMGAEDKDGVKGGGGYPPIAWNPWNGDVKVPAGESEEGGRVKLVQDEMVVV